MEPEQPANISAAATDPASAAPKQRFVRRFVRHFVRHLVRCNCTQPRIDQPTLPGPRSFATVRAKPLAIQPTRGRTVFHQQYDKSKV